MITGSYSPMLCGVGDYANKLVNALRNTGKLNVDVLTSEEVSKNYFQHDYIKSVIPEWGFACIAKIIKSILDISPDIVHIQFPTQGYAGSYAPYFIPIISRLCGVPVVQTWHESPTRIRFIPAALVATTIIGVEADFDQHFLVHYKIIARKSKKVFIPIGPNIPASVASDYQIAALRNKFTSDRRKIIVYFGMVYDRKGVEQIFDICDPTKHIVVLISNLDKVDDPYQTKIRIKISDKKWVGHVFLTGNLDPHEVANYLKMADAAIFPFKSGVGKRNGSVLAAMVQGTFVLTTSTTETGYCDQRNTYYAVPNNLVEMTGALDRYAARRSNRPLVSDVVWSDIATEHLMVYNKVLSRLC
jgi:glycosyltransferase involved in cell wall biosynthesis